MKIAICTPHYADVSPQYCLSLVSMVSWTLTKATILVGEAQITPEINVFMASSSTLPRVRNYLAKAAAEWGGDYLLWIDADHGFPQDSLIRLLSHHLPVVGVNQPTRTSPPRASGVSLTGEPLITTREKAEAGLVEEVGFPGLAFCLVEMRVVEALRNTGEPLFENRLWGEGINGDESTGEDVHFFRRVRQAGFPVHVDHGLSWEIGHAHQVILSTQDIQY
jgi:hypothetical protein